ncbi:MAG: metallophosphoesterase [Prevotellaceae bacterium]|jgi:predicted MPP superfamily phosphohydrolase|nr:metallophosphoesterase [Prevotellaceae bacterium]
MNNNVNLLMPLLFVAAVLLLNMYASQPLRTLSAPVWVRAAYWVVITLSVVAPVAALVLLARRGEMTIAGGWAMSALMLFLAPVLVMAAALLLEDVARLAALAVRYSLGLSPAALPRARWVGIATLSVGGVVLLAMLHGMVWGKYDYRVREQVVYFDDLPHSFDGFRILQLSDFHAGSLSSAKDVQRGVDMAKAQRADLFVFSGDMVNNSADELRPWASYLAQIKAPCGQVAVLGNHDYGDYGTWESAKAKAANLQSLLAQEEAIGLRVLLDENVAIERNGQAIVVVGVQNIGMRSHFVSYGNLQKALAGADSGAFKLLVSHDPSHWDEEVSRYPEKIHLTLSGHTHGFQFGIETPLFKWSPVQWIYPHWAGLYEKNGRYLYVNRGFGFIPFFLGRVGIFPEITVLELRVGKPQQEG